MSFFQRLEKEKMRQSAKMADGFTLDASISHGLVAGGENLFGQYDAGGHGLVIPWMGSQHISIVVGTE